MSPSEPYLLVSLLFPESLEITGPDAVFLEPVEKSAGPCVISVANRDELGSLLASLTRLCPESVQPMYRISLPQAEVVVSGKALRRMGMIEQGRCRTVSDPVGLLGGLSGIVPAVEDLLEQLAPRETGELFRKLNERHQLTEDMLVPLLRSGRIAASSLSAAEQKRCHVICRSTSGEERPWERLVLAMLQDSLVSDVLQGNMTHGVLDCAYQAVGRGMRAVWRMWLVNGGADRLAEAASKGRIPLWFAPASFWEAIESWLSPALGAHSLRARLRRSLGEGQAAVTGQAQALAWLSANGSRLAAMLVRSGNRHPGWELDELVRRVHALGLLRFLVARTGFADCLRVSGLAGQPAKNLLHEAWTNGLRQVADEITRGRLVPGFGLTPAESRHALERFFCLGMLVCLLAGDEWALSHL